MFRYTLPAFSLLLLATNVSNASALRYDFIEADIAASKARVKYSGEKLSLSGRSLSVNMAMSLDETYFITLGANQIDIDDSDRFVGNTSIQADLEFANQTLLIGSHHAISENTDIVLMIGADRADNRTKTRSTPPSTLHTSSIKQRDTSLAWSIGTRSFFPSGYELELALSGRKDQTQFAISGPMYLTQNLGINTFYSYTYDRKRPHKSEVQTLGLGLRYYYQ